MKMTRNKNSVLTPLDKARIAVVREAIARLGALSLDPSKVNDISCGALDTLIETMVESDQIFIGTGAAWVAVPFARPEK